MASLATREMHYVVNPKHAQLIGTVLLFATKKEFVKVKTDFINLDNIHDSIFRHSLFLLAKN